MIDLGRVPMAACGPVLSGYSSGTTPYASTVGLYAFGLPDDSIVVFGDGYPNGIPANCINVYRIDPSGKYTWYQVNVGNRYIIQIVPSGSGLFFVLLSDGISFTISTQNLKANNVSPIQVILTSAFRFPPPCSNVLTLPPTKIFLDATQGVGGLIVVGWYKPFGAYAQVYTSLFGIDLYSGGISGPSYQGYAGDTIGGDPMDFTTASLPPGYNLSSTANSSSGQFLQNLTGFQGQGSSLGQNQFYINPGYTNCTCGTMSDPQDTALVTGTSVTFQGNPNYTPPTFTDGHFCMLDSCIAGVSGIASVNGGYITPIVQSGNKTYTAELDLNANEGNVVITPRKVWVLSYNGNSQSQAYVSVGGNPGFVGAYFRVVMETHFSANYTRPISVYGAFKA